MEAAVDAEMGEEGRMKQVGSAEGAAQRPSPIAQSLPPVG